MLGVLTSQQIRKLIDANPPLITGYVDLELQLQPNGFDLSLSEIAAFSTTGMIDFNNQERRLADTQPLDFGSDGKIRLTPGCYLVTFNETVNIPENITALAAPRSSLLRCGVNMNNAVWDAGYRGRSQSQLVVHNPYGFTLMRNARLLQLVFFELADATEGYRGIYQNET